MKLTLHTVDGGEVAVEQFDPEGLPDLLTALDDPLVNSMRLELDGGQSFVQLVRQHVVRVDIDWENDAPQDAEDVG